MTLLEVLAIVTDREEPATVEVNPVMSLEGSTSSSKVMTAVSPSEGTTIEDIPGGVVSTSGTDRVKSIVMASASLLFLPRNSKSIVLPPVSMTDMAPFCPLPDYSPLLYGPPLMDPV
jgi:hypothetical protein